MLSKALWSAFIAAKGLKPRWRELDAFASLSPPQARLDLARRLQAQIQYFGSREDALPEWRSAARIQDPLEVWRRWPELPIVTKEMLRTQFNAHNLQARLKVPGVVASTGGSTGEPVWYFHDQPTLDSRGATGLYTRMRMGWYPGMPTICVWGSERDIGQQMTLRGRVSRFFRNDYLVDGYNLGSHTVEMVMTLINRHRPVALYGFTSMLEFIARQILAARMDVREGSVAVAWNGGEMLFPEQTELFRKAFKAPIHNLYGGRELGAIAHQVDANGPMFVLRPYIFLEIVDKNGAPAQPGESGRVICTSTVCRGTPFLRYEVGDVASFSLGHHDESGIRAIVEIQGRIAGLLHLPNGKVINCLYWNHLLKGFSEIHQFQVVVRRTGTIDLLLKGEGLSAERESRLQSVVQNFLCDVPIRLNWVERIPLTPQGKLVQVVREEPQLGAESIA